MAEAAPFLFGRWCKGCGRLAAGYDNLRRALGACGSLRRGYLDQVEAGGSGPAGVVIVAEAGALGEVSGDEFGVRRRLGGALLLPGLWTLVGKARAPGVCKRLERIIVRAGISGDVRGRAFGVGSRT